MGRKKTFQGAFRCRFAGACIRCCIRSSWLAVPSDRFRRKRAMPHPGHPNFEDCRPRNSGMRAALNYRSAEAEPFGAEGPDAPFGEIHFSQPMAVFPSEHVRSRPGRGHAMPLRRQARDVGEIARFVRAFAENRANRGDFHETCLKLSLLSRRGGTGVHGPARCGWRVLPSGACGRKNTPRPLAGPGVACFGCVLYSQGNSWSAMLCASSWVRTMSTSLSGRASALAPTVSSST